MSDPAPNRDDDDAADDEYIPTPRERWTMTIKVVVGGGVGSAIYYLWRFADKRHTQIFGACLYLGLAAFFVFVTILAVKRDNERRRKRDEQSQE